MQLKITTESGTLVNRLEHTVIREIHFLRLVVQGMEVIVETGEANDVKSGTREPMGDIQDGVAGDVWRGGRLFA